MIINAATLAAIRTMFSAAFADAYGSAATVYERLAMVVPSTTKSNTYAWLGALPGMREWVGDRIIRNLKENPYTIPNKDWELTIEVDRNDITDDNLGIYAPMIAELGRAAGIHPDELVMGALAAGVSTPCFDGENFFSTSHKAGKSSVSNYGGGSETPWYLLDVSRNIKPLLFQVRENPQFTAMDTPTDEGAFMKKKYRYGVDRRDNVGYGLWQLGYMSKLPLTPENYAAARAAMMSFKDDGGNRPLGITPGLLVVPGTLEGAARTVLMNERAANGATNPWYKTADLLVTPYL